MEQSLNWTMNNVFKRQLESCLPLFVLFVFCHLQHWIQSILLNFTHHLSKWPCGHFLDASLHHKKKEVFNKSTIVPHLTILIPFHVFPIYKIRQPGCGDYVNDMAYVIAYCLLTPFWIFGFEYAWKRAELMLRRFKVRAWHVTPRDTFQLELSFFCSCQTRQCTTMSISPL